MNRRRLRVAPLDDAAWNDEVREIVSKMGENGPIPNIVKTLARHPKLLKRWNVFANHVLHKSTLPPREREILILRIGWLCKSEYEWGQHVLIGKRAGLTGEEIQRITEGPDAPGWSPFDAALLRAAGELHRDAVVSDSTWNALAGQYDVRQLMDVVFTVGQYNLVSMALNTLGVQRDPGVPGFLS